MSHSLPYPTTSDTLQKFACQKLSAAAVRWTHCQWRTHYGPLGLDLQGITSRQASIAAQAMSGREAACWREAADWLARLEEDAYRASELAEVACQRLRQGDRCGALQALQSAIRIEQQYRRDSGWQPLYDAIQQRED